MICPECHKELYDGAVCCPDCGISTADMKKMGSFAGGEPHKNFKAVLWIWWLIGFVYVFIGLILWLVFRKSAPAAARAAGALVRLFIFAAVMIFKLAKG